MFYSSSKFFNIWWIKPEWKNNLVSFQKVNNTDKIFNHTKIFASYEISIRKLELFQSKIYFLDAKVTSTHQEIQVEIGPKWNGLRLFLCMCKKKVISNCNTWHTFHIHVQNMYEITLFGSNGIIFVYILCMYPNLLTSIPSWNKKIRAMASVKKEAANLSRWCKQYYIIHNSEIKDTFISTMKMGKILGYSSTRIIARY